MTRTIKHSLWIAALIGAWTLYPALAAAQTGGSGASTSGSSQSQQPAIGGLTPATGAAPNPALPQPMSPAQPGPSGSAVAPGAANRNVPGSGPLSSTPGQPPNGTVTGSPTNGQNPAAKQTQGNPQVNPGTRPTGQLPSGPSQAVPNVGATGPSAGQIINPGTGPLSSPGRGGLFNPGIGNRGPSGNPTPAYPGGGTTPQGTTPQGTPGSR